MKGALVALLRSRKFLVALFTAIAAAAGKIGLDLDSETVGIILSPFIILIVGQAVEDVGRGAAKERVDGAKAGVESVSMRVEATRDTLPPPVAPDTTETNKLPTVR